MTCILNVKEGKANLVNAIYIFSERALTWFTKGSAQASHSVDHLEDDPVLKAPSFRGFKVSHSSGKPLKSICMVNRNS
jgi:hypothetical protein